MANNVEDRLIATPEETLSERSSPSLVEMRTHSQQTPILHSDKIPPEAQKTFRESPPPLIHIKSHCISPQAYTKNNRPPSPQIFFNHSKPPEDQPGSLYQYNHYNRFSEEPDDRQRVVVQNIETQSTRQYPLRSAQPLQNVPPVCNSFERSVDSIKFGAQLQDIRLQSCNWIAPPLIGSSVENIAPRALPLSHQHQRHSLELLQSHRELHRPIRPLPLSVSPPHHTSGPFPEHMWNRMVLSLNLGLHQPNPRGERLDGFHGNFRSQGFNSRNVFHSA